MNLRGCSLKRHLTCDPRVILHVYPSNHQITYPLRVITIEVRPAPKVQSLKPLEQLENAIEQLMLMSDVTGEVTNQCTLDVKLECGEGTGWLSVAKGELDAAKRGHSEGTGSGMRHSCTREEARIGRGRSTSRREHRLKAEWDVSGWVGKHKKTDLCPY